MPSPVGQPTPIKLRIVWKKEEDLDEHTRNRINGHAKILRKQLGKIFAEAVKTSINSSGSENPVSK